MRVKAVFVCAMIFLASAITIQAADSKLDGAYKYVSTKFPGGEQTEAQAKGMIVVHGNYMAYVQAGVDRKTWDQSEPEDARMKKMVEAYQGLRATAGHFEISGDTITLHQMAQSAPSSMGKEAKWKYKLDGNKLMLTPEGNAQVVFTFERLP